MAMVKPFQSLRPVKQFADKVASPPYDVLNSAEAREIVKNNPYSFLRVVKPEVDLEPGIDLYSEPVYLKGVENLNRFKEDGILKQDSNPYFYVYKQVMGAHQQVGLVACASVEEYERDIIKKHELTRPDKEDDRVNHIRHLNAQTGPVFLTYRSNTEIDALILNCVESEPEYDFFDDQNVHHIYWVIKDQDTIARLQSAFNKVDYLYVADGHHRSAAAMRIKQMRQFNNPNHSGNEEYNYFLTVIFPDNQMQILDYNRVIKDLNGLEKSEFLEKVSEKFSINKLEKGDNQKPSKKHSFRMYLDACWHELNGNDGIFDKDNPVDRLDVSILQNNILAPLLGIHDPRKDHRIDFVGGIRGMTELEKRVNSGDWQVAFALYPTAMEDLMAIAEAGKIMPPKSTWFEPKLRSGLAIHLLD
jgi:uncharacterized protein (DUF1015 family)